MRTSHLSVMCLSVTDIVPRYSENQDSPPQLQRYNHAYMLLIYQYNHIRHNVTP